MSRVRRFDVAFPLLGFNPSGGVRMLIHVANTLAARGATVAISVPASAADPPIALHPEIALLVRPRGRMGFVTRLPYARVAVASGYQTPALISAGAFLRGRSLRVFYLIQGDERASHIDLGRRPAWVRPLLRAAAALGYAVPATRVAVSRFVAERVGTSRIHRVINPGIEAAYLRPIEARSGPGDVRVGILAGGDRVKGTDVALTAFSLLRERGVRAVAFDRTGSVPLPAFVERFPARSLEAFYSHCDVFVFPSRVEGFGLPPLEAMARGAAVVLTDCGGVREYAEHGVNCVMVPPGDAEATAAAIRELAENPDRRARVARAGRATAERFPLERFTRACADEIEILMNRSKS